MLAILAALCLLGAQPPAREKTPDAPTAARFSAADDEMDRVLAKQLRALKDKGFTEAMAFWASRMALLDRVEHEVPELAATAGLARKETKAAFEAGFQALHAAYLARDPGNALRWSAAEAQCIQKAREQEIGSRAFADQAAAGGLDPRQAPRSSASLLVSLNPVYREKPEASFDDGFASVFALRDEDGTEVARVRIPTAFAATGEQRPGSNILAWGGYAPAVVTLTVAKTEAELDAKAAADRMVASLNANPKARLKGVREVDTPIGRGAIVAYEVEVSTRSAVALGKARDLIVPVGGHLVSIAASVMAGEGDGQRERLDSLLLRFEPLFDRVRESLERVEAKKER